MSVGPFMYTCMCVFIYRFMFRLYVRIYTYICSFCVCVCVWVCECVCVCVCVCVCLSHEEVATATSFTLSPNSPYLNAYLVIQRRQMKCGSTQELPWDGDQLMWQSYVAVFCDNIECTARYRQTLRLFGRKQRIMLTAGNNLLWLELSCWLSACTFGAVLLLLKETAWTGEGYDIVCLVNNISSCLMPGDAMSAGEE